ncbi:uncharacterized protein LOC126326563 [Schistocerca gregaria]|uniref:uncharacterized protein LOC126326563 n=1 Tax=Schistocerca gregaria TaxID=7010 RepID=UPI00211EDCC7|nr:uncharacterized protein LOC126326563 [Schistocerca gregaria]
MIPCYFLQFSKSRSRLAIANHISRLTTAKKANCLQLKLCRAFSTPLYMKAWTFHPHCDQEVMSSKVDTADPSTLDEAANDSLEQVPSGHKGSFYCLKLSEQVPVPMTLEAYNRHFGVKEFAELEVPNGSQAYHHHSYRETAEKDGLLLHKIQDDRCVDTKTLTPDNAAPQEPLDPTAFPRIPKSHILVKVIASSINALDLRMQQGYGRQFFSRLRENDGPIVPGRDFSGVVVGCGENVLEYKVGDLVMGASWPWSQNGCWAEYVVVSEFHVVKKPESLSHVEASALAFSGITAWHAIFSFAKQNKGRESQLIDCLSGSNGSSDAPQLKSDQEVSDTICSLICSAEQKKKKLAFVHGAAGAVGTIAVQLLKALGYCVLGSGKAAHKRYLEEELKVDLFIDLDGATDQKSHLPQEPEAIYAKSALSFPESCFDFVLDCIGGAETSELEAFENLAVTWLKKGGEFVTTNGRAISHFDNAFEKWSQQSPVESICHLLGQTLPKKNPSDFSNVQGGGQSSLLCFLSSVGSSAVSYIQRKYAVESMYEVGYQWAYFYPDASALRALTSLAAARAIFQPVSEVTEFAEVGRMVRRLLKKNVDRPPGKVVIFFS